VIKPCRSFGRWPSIGTSVAAWPGRSAALGQLAILLGDGFYELRELRLGGIRAAESVKVVQKRLGRTSPQMTRGVYGRLWAEEDDQTGTPFRRSSVPACPACVAIAGQIGADKESIACTRPMNTSYSTYNTMIQRASTDHSNLSGLELSEVDVSYPPPVPEPQPPPPPPPPPPPTKAPSSSENWWHNPVVVAIALLCCFPIGLVLLWTSKWDQKVKIIITAIFAVLLMIGAISNAVSPKQTSTNTTMAEVGQQGLAPVAPSTTPLSPPTTSTSTSPTTPVPTQPPIPNFADGTHVVGTDIEAGRYIVQANAGCYWARLRDASGDMGSIIANDNANGQAVVDIAATDGLFESKRCGRWQQFNETTARPPESIGDGTWAVGIQVTPGRYRNTGGTGCYWARLSNFGEEMGSILANDNVSGQTIVDVAPTDVGFNSNRCGTWQKVG
jgi:hypothetical protein